MATTGVQEYSGLEVFRKHVLEQFQDPQGCDFKIICGDRTFHVHKLVISGLEYFANMLNGNWVESRKDVATLVDDDPEMILLLLSYLYGASYDGFIVPACQGSLTDEEILKAKATKFPYALMDGSTEFSEFLRPTIDLLNSSLVVRADKDELRRTLRLHRTLADLDPQPFTSGIVCREMAKQINLYVIADKYQVLKLREKIDDRMCLLLPDCWNSPIVFKLARKVCDHKIPALRTDSKIVQHLSIGIGKRLDIFCANDHFKSAARASESLAAIAIEGVFRPAAWIFPHAAYIQFCSTYECRMNQCFEEREEHTTTCLQCGERSWEKRRNSPRF